MQSIDLKDGSHDHSARRMLFLPLVFSYSYNTEHHGRRAAFRDLARAGIHALGDAFPLTSKPALRIVSMEH